MQLTNKLFAYASRYAARAERADKGTQRPTIRQAKRRFRGLTYQDVEDACANYQGPGYMGIGVGVGLWAHGWASTENENDHVIEAYE